MTVRLWTGRRRGRLEEAVAEEARKLLAVVLWGGRPLSLMAVDRFRQKRRVSEGCLLMDYGAVDRCD